MESYRYLVICMMLLMVVPITYALNYQVFSANPELQNKNIDALNMTELDSRSVIRCAVQCTNNCACFGFNSIINKCRVYKNCNLGDSVPGDNGWIYFAVKLSLSLSIFFLFLLINFSIFLSFTLLNNIFKM